MGAIYITNDWNTCTLDELRHRIQIFIQNHALQLARRQGNLTTVKAVGATIDSDGYLSPRDASILWHSLTLLVRTGYNLTADFEIDVINLMQGRNYLDESRDADIHIMCYIYNPAAPQQEQQYIDDNQKLVRTAQKDPLKFMGKDFHYVQAGNHYETNIWALAAQRQSARIIITYGESTWEISTAEFSTPENNVIIPTDTGFSPLPAPLRKYPEKPYGIIMPNIFLEQTGPHLVGKTFLNTQIQETLNRSHQPTRRPTMPS